MLWHYTQNGHDAPGVGGDAEVVTLFRGDDEISMLRWLILESQKLAVERKYDVCVEAMTDESPVMRMLRCVCIDWRVGQENGVYILRINP